MSNDKTRRARIQGGWSASARPATRSDCSKQPMPAVPAWIGKNADPPTDKKFVYEEPVEEVNMKPKEMTIEKSGVYDLSTEPNGISRIRLFTNFIEQKECEWIFDQLSQELPWRQRSDVKNNQEYLQPRLTAWYGDLPYMYSGVKHQPNNKWNPVLTMLKDRLEEVTGYKFNSMLANLYRDGHDHVPWHSDDETALGSNPTIASLSFGDTRLFELRKKPAQELREQNDYSNCEIVRVPLDAGTLLIMEGSTQDDWHHRIAREYHDRGPRINLTFRVIHTES